MAFVEGEAAPPERRRAWLVPVVLGILAITITHHVTSYALAIIFAVLAVLYRVLKVKRPNPWPLALLATVTALAWLLIAARTTVGYLWPVLREAIEGVWKIAAPTRPRRSSRRLRSLPSAPARGSRRWCAPRTLFHASATSAEAVGVTPTPARAVAIFSVLLLALLAFPGLLQLWRRRRRDPFVLVLGAAAIVFFGALLLRFAPAAWETGNRAGEFLFIGLAFAGIYGAARFLRVGPTLERRRLLLTAGLAVIFVGGAISGWPWDVQLARPLQVKAHGREIDSEPLALAEFASKRMSGSRFAAPEADARLLLTPGRQIAFGGQGPDVEDIVNNKKIAPWQLPVLRKNNLPYVVADRRRNSGDTLRGYYFDSPGQYGQELRPGIVVHKFARIPVGRVWDSGWIVLYDLKDRPRP
jgi:hypothetical protein